ncbi:MAG: 50S ribosomal protein L31 [Anaerolineae bacterium]|nr:50S ribosomal protein L31 [Anaerolineae bacterium]
MKTDIHPKYYPNAKVICSCGNTWTTGSTQELIRTDVCSKCHPFFTGEQRIVDTAGQVDRFMKRLDRYGEHQAEAIKRQEEVQEKIGQRFFRQQLIALELSDRIYQILKNADVVTVGDLAAMDKNQLLALEGFGPKALEEVETKLNEARAAFLEVQ